MKTKRRKKFVNRSKQKKDNFSKINKVFLIIVSIFTVVPLAVVLVNSFRQYQEKNILSDFFKSFTLDNYLQAFQKVNYGEQLINSIIITVVSMLLITIIAALAAYPLSRIKTVFSKNIFYFIILGMVVPAQIIIVPLLKVLNVLHISNGRFTAIIPFVASSLPLAIFIYAGFINMIPREYEEAAFVDGANVVRRFFVITLPLLKPATIAVVITQGVTIWNDYFFQMIFAKGSRDYTLALGMLQFVGEKDNVYGLYPLFATCILSILPMVILLIIYQKDLVDVSVGSMR